MSNQMFDPTKHALREAWLALDRETDTPKQKARRRKLLWRHRKKYGRFLR